MELYGEESTVGIETEEELEAAIALEEESEPLFFTLEDAKTPKVCDECRNRKKCPILDYVNVLSVKKYGKGAGSYFGCTMLVEEDKFVVEG